MQPQQAIHRIFEQALNPTSRWLLTTIMFSSDEDGVCRLTQAELADRTGISERQIARLLPKLEGAGYLYVQPGRGRRPARYVLLLGRTRDEIVDILITSVGLPRSVAEPTAELSPETASTRPDRTRSPDTMSGQAGATGEATSGRDGQEPRSPDMMSGQTDRRPDTMSGQAAEVKLSQEVSENNTRETTAVNPAPAQNDDAAHSPLERDLIDRGVYPSPARAIMIRCDRYGVDAETALAIFDAHMADPEVNIRIAVWRMLNVPLVAPSEAQAQYEQRKTTETTSDRAETDRRPAPKTPTHAAFYDELEADGPDLASDTAPPDEKSEDEQLWERVLAQMKLQMTNSTFERLLAGSTAVAREGSALQVEVRSQYAIDWLERKWCERILETVAYAGAEGVERLEFTA